MAMVKSPTFEMKQQAGPSENLFSAEHEIVDHRSSSRREQGRQKFREVLPFVRIVHSHILCI